MCGVSESMSFEIVTSDEGQELAIQCYTGFSFSIVVAALYIITKHYVSDRCFRFFPIRFSGQHLSFIQGQ